MKLAAVVVAVLVFVCPALAFAAPKACTCKNLESIQQELKNAVYLEDFMRQLSRKVADAEEAHRQLKKKEPNNPVARRALRDVSKAEWTKEKAKLRVPKVPGDNGPEELGLEDGTCENNPQDLKDVANGAACKDLGDIVLKHEEAHRKLCSEDKDKYWKRLYSEIAAEEADRYRDQAKAVRALLKKVIDGATVKISEETDLKITSGPMEYTYKLAMPAFKLTGKSSPGSDDWELTGKGKRTVAVTSVKIPGMTCTPPTQKLSSKVTGTLKLDGLTMKLDATSETEGGTLTMKCKAPGKGEGIGMGVAPPGETGGAEVFKNKEVDLMSTFPEDIPKTSWGKAINQTGVKATGTQTTKVEITCN